MKTKKNILIAFILNFIFSLFEFVGGAFTGSVAILSDAVHDIGDALSIGISYFLERKSKKQPDSIFTYGYARFSILGSLITTVILLFGSLSVAYNAIIRILNPVEINYDGMFFLAIIGVLVNLIAALFTRDGDSLNQKAVNLHMLEDVLGWIIVLIGAVVMRFTDMLIIDPIMSIAVSAFIFANALKNLKRILDLFLEKIPHDINIDEIKEHVLEIDGVLNVHHIHIRSIDGYNHYATMHVVCSGDPCKTKKTIREELKEHNLVHSTLELEAPDEKCEELHCHINFNDTHSRHLHHHH